MAQTEKAISFVAADAYIGAADLNLSWGPYGVSVAVEGGTRAVGVQHTRDSDYPIQKSGKRAGLSVTVRYVYTETVSEFHDTCIGIYDTELGACQFQWIPGSAASLGLGYVITGGIMTDFLYPQGTVDPGEVLLGEVKISTSRIIEYQVEA